MNSLDFKLLASHHKKNLIVKNTPYGHCTTNNFFPDNGHPNRQAHEKLTQKIINLIG